MTDKSRLLYLGEAISIDQPEFSRNNLILSPVGSGKTHFILNQLANKINGNKLFLVSNTFLKDSMKLENGVFTTQDMRLRRELFNLKDKNVHVMTYAELGKRIMHTNNFCNNYEMIFCDEIHSLFEYAQYGGSGVTGLVSAIKYLFKTRENQYIFYFTATDEKIKSYQKKHFNELYKDVKVFNYLEREDIMKFTEVTRSWYSHANQISGEIRQLTGLKEKGYKGLIFTQKISSMLDFQETLKEEGFNSLLLWSINNEDNIMSESQLKSRDELIENQRIPDEYDFLIINAAMREGWNLNDDRVEFVIINSTSETDITQARGRVRKDIFKLILRVEKGELDIENLITEKIEETEILNQYLNTNLSQKEKNDISNEMNIMRDNGQPVKWNTIKKVAIQMGYEIVDKRVREDGVMKRVSVIS